MPQMNHCTRCRADAAGLLGAPMAKEITEILMESKKLPLHPREKRPFIAVASREGILVNQHLGEATELWIFGKVDGENLLIENALFLCQAQEITGGLSLQEYLRIAGFFLPPGQGLTLQRYWINTA